MTAPLVCVGVFESHDPVSLLIRAVRHVGDRMNALKFNLKESSGQMLVCERMLSSLLDRSRNV